MREPVRPQKSSVRTRKIVPLSVEPADLIGDVRALAGAGIRIDEALLDAAMRGWSENTRRAFRSDLTLWGQWCRLRRVEPAVARPADVAAWIRALSGTETCDLKTRAIFKQRGSWYQNPRIVKAVADDGTQIRAA